AIVHPGACIADPPRDIAPGLEMPALAADPRITTFGLQVTNRAQLQHIFPDRFEQTTTAHGLGRLYAPVLPIAPVRRPAAPRAPPGAPRPGRPTSPTAPTGSRPRPRRASSGPSGATVACTPCLTTPRRSESPPSSSSSTLTR